MTQPRQVLPPHPLVEGVLVDLLDEGHVTEEEARSILSIVARRLVSLRVEVQVLLSTGSLFLTGGLGAYLREHDLLSRHAIMIAVAVLGLLSVAWGAPRLAHLTRGRRPEPPALHGTLLGLGAAVISTDIGVAQALDGWPSAVYLIAAGVLLPLAVLCDSRVVLSNACVMLGAYLGLELVSWTEIGVKDELRNVALVYASVLGALGCIARGARFKPHFGTTLLDIACPVALLTTTSRLFMEMSTPDPEIELEATMSLVAAGLVLGVGFGWRLLRFAIYGFLAIWLTAALLCLRWIDSAELALILIGASAAGVMGAAWQLTEAIRKRPGELSDDRSEP